MQGHRDSPRIDPLPILSYIVSPNFHDLAHVMVEEGSWFQSILKTCRLMSAKK